MKYQFTSGQIEQYRRDGFLVVEGFLDDAELEHWREVTEDAVRKRLEEKGGLANQDSSDYYAQVFTQCLRLADIHSGMAELMLDPRLGEAAATLAGVDAIRIWHDQALFKPPYGNPTSWHLDNPYWSFHSPDSISIWVALDDATYANGCMWYIPGSHLEARYDNASIGPSMGDLFLHYPQWNERDAVACPCRAGSAVFHNGLTAHAAGPNMTSRPRRAMTCAYMPDGCRFNGRKNILPDDYFNSLRVGDLLNDDRQNPLIWQRPAT